MSSIDCSTSLITSPPGASDTRPAGEPARHWLARYPAHRLGRRVPVWLARVNYRFGQLIGRSVFFMTMNVRSVRLESADRDGGYVLACSHLSHLDPICVGILAGRKVDWMSRIEFFRFRLVAAYLWACDAFPVKRFSFTGRAVRTAIARAAGGGVVGIFPEGGVCTGKASVCRGGPIKRGACVVAQRAGVPIIPCVIVGTHELNRPLPWIPYRRGNLRLVFGRPIEPRRGVPGSRRRAARFEMAERLRAEFRRTFDELLQTFDIPDAEVP
jgi:1-acyl-sn-glycerol-3-phosphate acyltransferase